MEESMKLFRQQEIPRMLVAISKVPKDHFDCPNCLRYVDILLGELCYKCSHGQPQPNLFQRTHNRDSWAQPFL